MFYLKHSLPDLSGKVDKGCAAKPVEGNPDEVVTEKEKVVVHFNFLVAFYSLLPPTGFPSYSAYWLQNQLIASF